MTPYDVKSHINMKRLLTTDFNQLYPDAVHSFKASGPWLNRFLNRYNFSLRRRTKISQKLPKDLHENFVRFTTTSVHYKKTTIFNSTALLTWMRRLSF